MKDFSGRDYCVLDLRVGRQLNGIRKKEGIVELPLHLRRKLEQILPVGGGAQIGLSALVNLPICFRGQIEDIIDCIEGQAGFTAKDLFERMRLMKKAEDFFNLIVLAMQYNLSKSPNLRFKVLVDKELPESFCKLLARLFLEEHMDMRVELIEVHFIDEIVDACCNDYPVLREITFKVGNEIIVRPFVTVWETTKK